MTRILARVAVLTAVLYAARRYYRNWGTTKDECRLALPGDELAKGPVIRTTEGVTIDAPAEAVWRLVIERHQPAMRVERVVDNSALVLVGEPPDYPWRTVMSFHVLPRLSDRCRVLVRTRTELRHPGQVLLVELAGPATAMLNRATLLGLKHQAEAAEHLTPEHVTPEQRTPEPLTRR